MHIPLRIRLLHNFGRSSFIIGFLFAIIGLSFVFYFSLVINWKILLAGKDDFSLTMARISEIESTSYSVNENNLMEYRYLYSVGELENLQGSFLEYEGAYDEQEEIRIEFLEADPGVSRISGTDRRNSDRIMFLGGVGGLLVGAFFLYPSIRKTRRERKTLITGRPARARLIHAEPTNLNINEQTVYNLTYEYSTGNNKNQEFSLRSHMIRNLSDEHYETIIYDPRYPDRPVLIDTLPGTVARYVSRKLAVEIL